MRERHLYRCCAPPCTAIAATAATPPPQHPRTTTTATAKPAVAAIFTSTGATMTMTTAPPPGHHPRPRLAFLAPFVGRASQPPWQLVLSQDGKVQLETTRLIRISARKFPRLYERYARNLQLSSISVLVLLQELGMSFHTHSASILFWVGCGASAGEGDWGTLNP